MTPESLIEEARRLISNGEFSAAGRAIAPVAVDAVPRLRFTIDEFIDDDAPVAPVVEVGEVERISGCTDGEFDTVRLTLQPSDDAIAWVVRNVGTGVVRTAEVLAPGDDDDGTSVILTRDLGVAVDVVAIDGAGNEAATRIELPQVNCGGCAAGVDVALVALVPFRIWRTR